MRSLESKPGRCPPEAATSSAPSSASAGEKRSPGDIGADVETDPDINVDPLGLLQGVTPPGVMLPATVLELSPTFP
jgi:hypothetical protein